VQNFQPCGYVAVKRLYPTASPERLYNELNILARLRHENVIRLITAERCGDKVCGFVWG
jgi:serine/threonine protein kinase